MIAVIEHEPACGLDRFAGWLGVPVKVIRPYAGDEVPESAGEGLIVLGGNMSADDDQVAPWLPAVRDLLKVSAADGVPTLGICLGAQLLAVACGGRVDVAASPGRESGVVDIEWLPAASDDPLMKDLPDPAAGPSMHADAVAELPPGAVWLGRTGMYPYQAFRVGPAAWGVQFHPEVSLPTFRDWADGHPEVDTAAVTAELVARDNEVSIVGQAIAMRFAALAT
jgi:GMP synthase (glutamine-hydrolysing)